MKDVTQFFNRYRECVRHLWNTYFLEWEAAAVNWDISDEYAEICTKLFSALVLTQVGRNTHKKSQSFEHSPSPFPFFLVIPAVKGGAPIHVNREKHGSPYWDHPPTHIKPDEAELQFIDFFDFGELEFRHFQYCRVRIVGSTVNPNLIGHDALLEGNHVRILFDDTVS